MPQLYYVATFNNSLALIVKLVIVFLTVPLHDVFTRGIIGNTEKSTLKRDFNRGCPRNCKRQHFLSGYNPWPLRKREGFEGASKCRQPGDLPSNMDFLKSLSRIFLKHGGCKGKVVMAIQSGASFVAAIKLIQVKAFGLIFKFEQKSLQKFHQCVIACLWFYQGSQCLCYHFQQSVRRQNNLAKSGLAKPRSLRVCKWLLYLSAGFNACPVWNFCATRQSAVFQRVMLNLSTASSFPFPLMSVQSVKQVKVKAPQNGFVLAIE